MTKKHWLTMSPERKTIIYRNPVSSRAQKAYKNVEQALRGWRTSRLESPSPRIADNVYDLAERIEEGASLIVVGGDGQLRTAAEAAKLAGLKDVVIVPVPGGNSCDGSRTYHRKQNILRRNRLRDLLLHGEQLAVNTLDIHVNGQSYGTAVNYAGIGLTAYCGEAMNGRLVRTTRAKIPASQHMNGLMRVLEAGVVGATVVKHLGDNLVYERGNDIVQAKELLYASGHSLAGTFQLHGDALEQQAPQVVRYEIDSEAFMRRLPGVMYGLMTGQLPYEKMASDTVIFAEAIGPVPIQLDGEHDYLEAGSTLTTSVHRASFQTLRPVA